MEFIYDFLVRLNENNNREWFEAYKQEYLEAQARFNLLVDGLIKDISAWDPDIDPQMKAKDCTYRIYRDVRFSKNKLPYKSHMGAYICKGGKKSPYAGYYFHVEPPGVETPDFLGGSHLFVGLHMPEPKIIHSLRDEIAVNGDSFLNAIKQAGGFELMEFDMLRKVPKGYEHAKPEWQELLRHRKDFSLGMELNKKFLFAPGLSRRLSAEFKKTLRFTTVLNMAVQYALEEM